MILVVTAVVAFHAVLIGVLVAELTGRDWLAFPVTTALFMASAGIGLLDIRRTRRMAPVTGIDQPQ